VLVHYDYSIVCDTRVPCEGKLVAGSPSRARTRRHRRWKLATGTFSDAIVIVDSRPCGASRRAGG